MFKIDIHINEDTKVRSEYCKGMITVPADHWISKIKQLHLEVLMSVFQVKLPPWNMLKMWDRGQLRTFIFVRLPEDQESNTTVEQDAYGMRKYTEQVCQCLQLLQEPDPDTFEAQLEKWEQYYEDMGMSDYNDDDDSSEEWCDDCREIGHRCRRCVEYANHEYDVERQKRYEQECQEGDDDDELCEYCGNPIEDCYCDEMCEYCGEHIDDCCCDEEDEDDY